MSGRTILIGLAVLAVAGAAYLGLRPDATVPEVAAAATKSTTGPAPRPAAPGTLDLEVDGLAFPDFSEFGWRAEGVRHDEIDGRDATTVSYRRDRTRLTYTVVAGEDHVNYEVPTVSGMRDGVEINWFQGGVYPQGAEQRPEPGSLALTVKRRSRTVVLTTDRVGRKQARELRRLALWRADGRLEF